VEERSRVFLSGAVTGLFGVAAFGAAHALTIVPIWRRLLGGLPFGVAAGLAMAWAFYELRIRRGRILDLRQGLLLGLLLWLTLIPMTALGVALRISGLRAGMGDWETVAESVLAFATGALAGRLYRSGYRPALALGAASLVLALAMGGPIAVLNSRRAALLFASFGALLPLSGVALAAVYKASGKIERRARCQRLTFSDTPPKVSTGPFHDAGP
jgi:hypothetical protein